MFACSWPLVRAPEPEPPTASVEPQPQDLVEASFITAIRTGEKPEGEPLLPPMPWPTCKNMADEDLKAIYAYLRTLTPVNNFARSAAPTE